MPTLEERIGACEDLLLAQAPLIRWLCVLTLLAFIMAFGALTIVVWGRVF